MGLVTFELAGDFGKTEEFLKKASRTSFLRTLDRYAKRGVDALSSATPVDTGKTAASWTYEIARTANSITITWINDNKTYTGIPIVLLLQYGHGTRNGGYVQGRDIINPAIKPIFDDIADNIWKQVKQL